MQKLPRLFLFLALTILALAFIAPARAQTPVLLQDISFAGHGNAGPASAGAILSDGLIDTQGGVWQVAGGLLTATTSSVSPSWTHGVLYASTLGKGQTNQKVVTTLVNNTNGYELVNLGYVDPNNHYFSNIQLGAGTVEIYKVVSGTLYTVQSLLSFTRVANRTYQVVFSRTVSGSTSTFGVAIYDVTGGGDPVTLADASPAFVATGITDTAPTLAVGGFGLDTQGGVASKSRVRFYGASLSATPASIAVSTTGNSVVMANPAGGYTPGTPGSPTFTLTGGTGAAITAQTVTDSGHVTLTVSAGSAQGTLTISDGTLTAPLTVTTPPALTVGTLAATPGPGSVTLSLSAGLSGGSGSGYGYKIYRSSLANNGTPSGDLLATLTNLSTVPYADTSGVVGTAYYYRVVGTDSAANLANSVPSGLGSVPTTSPLAVAAASQPQAVVVCWLGTSIYWGATLSGGVGTSSTIAPPDIGSPLLANLSGRMVYYTNQGQNGSRVRDYLPAATGQPTNSTYYAQVGAAVNSLVAAHPGALVVFSEMFETNETTAAAAQTPTQYNASETGLDTQLLTDYPSCKIVHHVAPYYTPNTANSGDYEEPGLALLAALRQSETPYVAGMAAAHPGQVFLGDTSAYTFFAANYLADMTGETGAKGTFYIHPNAAGAAALGTLQGQSLYRVLFAPLAPAAPPLTLTATAGVNSEVLTWTADSGATNGYEVDWKPSSVLPVAGQVKSIVAVVGTGVLTWTDTSAYRLSQNGRYNVVGLH